MEKRKENQLALDKRTGNRYFTPKGEKPATDVWVRRWLAHLCDAVIVIILGMLMYAAALGIAGPCGYDAKMDEYHSAQAWKLDFLTDVGIMVENEEGDSTLSDDEMFTRFIRAYVSPETLVYQKDGQTHYTDDLMEFYLNTIETLDIDFGDYDVPTDSREYFDKILVPDINEAVNADVFVFNEETNLPELNKSVDPENPDVLPYYDQLVGYVGPDENTPPNFSEATQSFAQRVAQAYLGARMTAGQLALCDVTAYANEVALTRISNDLGIIQTWCVIAGWLVALVGYRAVTFAVFRYGRTIGKRVLGYYVVDSKRRKAKVWQLAVRTAVEAVEQFWTIIFALLISFSGTAFQAPLFRVSGQPVTVFWFLLGSLAIYFISCFVALLRRNNMDSLHDLASHTVCIALEDSEIIEKHLKENETRVKEGSAEDVARNLDPESEVNENLGGGQP